MGDFCSDNKESITEANYAVSFENASRKSSLPNSGSGFSQVGSNGLVEQSAIDGHVTTLLANMNAIPPGQTDPNDLNPAENFAKASSALRANIGSEYCFYYNRYIYVLQKVLLIAASSEVNLAGNADYINKKKTAQDLNAKLNQLLQIMQGVINSRTNALNNYYDTSSGINSINKDLDDARKNLIEHMNKLKANDMEMDVRSSMIDYSIEKNSSSRNLLAVYGFMNIVAVGILFYLYKASK